MIAFSISSDDVKRIQVWKPREIKMRAFCCIPNFGVFKNMHICTFLLNLFKTKYCFVIQEVQLFKIVLSFKSLFYPKHY